jgi:hypothetical protein
MRYLASVFFLTLALTSNPASAGGSWETLNLALGKASRLVPEIKGAIASLRGLKGAPRNALYNEAKGKLSEFHFNLSRADQEWRALRQEKTERGRKFAERGQDAIDAYTKIKEFEELGKELESEFDCETAVPPCSGDADPEAPGR